MTPIQHTEQATVRRGEHVFRVVRAAYCGPCVDGLKVYHVYETFDDGSEEHVGILIADNVGHAKLQVIELL
jgi:hypothetical protein